MARKRSRHRITAFDLPRGALIAGKYEVIRRLGSGWEGEVYLVRERSTGVERAAKLFFPHRNPSNRALRYYARKLHLLRQCPILIQYHTQEVIEYEGRRVACLISEYVEGELLSEFIRRQPGRRLDPFQALHLLHEIASGIETIHHLGEYHGDLHTDNVIVSRVGIGFDVKLVDMYRWGTPKRTNIQDDVCDIVRILYDCLGGRRRYRSQPPEVKAVCCGLRRSLILRKFRTAGELREYLETFEWESM